MDPESAFDNSAPLLTYSATERRITFSEVVDEIKHLYSLAFPMIVAGLLIYGKSVISMLFLGWLGKDELAAGSLSIGIANITGYSIISGLAMGMDSISSQAFGARKWQLMSKTLYKTISILLSVCVPISVLWLNMEPVLLLFRQDPKISCIASIYLAFSIPNLVIQAFINPIKIFLRAQSVTRPIMVAAAISLSFHVPVNYIMVCKFDLGIKGVAVSAALTDLNMLVTTLGYFYFFTNHLKSLSDSFFYECFTEWKPILKLAIPSCMSVCLEWWWYELMIVLAGLLSAGTESIATMGILIQVTSFLYIFPSSLSLAVSTRVGNELGASQPGQAKASAFIALACALFTSSIAMLFTTSLRHIFGRAFSSDKKILSLTAKIMPVVGLCEIGNWPQTTGCGVLRGTARPGTGARVNFASFYCFGLPLAIILGFAIKMGLMGLWLGLLGAQFVCAILMVILLVRTDWITEANRARTLTGVTEEDQETESEIETEEDKEIQ